MIIYVFFVLKYVNKFKILAITNIIIGQYGLKFDKKVFSLLTGQLSEIIDNQGSQNRISDLIYHLITLYLLLFYQKVLYIRKIFLKSNRISNFLSVYRFFFF